MIDSRVLPFAFVNDSIIPIEQAQVPVLDRGFLFGDAVYEVVTVYAGTVFRAQSHVQRLMDSLEKIGIRSAHQADYWHDVFTRTAAANGGGDQYVYLQVTRGVGQYRDHATPKNIKPFVFAMSQKLMARSEKVTRHGVDAILLEDTRWARCDIKATSLLANVLLRQQAVEQNCAEAILHRDGWVTEGSASTIMLVSNSTLVVPPNNNEVLPGTTRRLIEELADKIGLPTELRKFNVEQLRSADEVLLSAATKEITAICHIDKQPVATGKPGPVWSQLDQAYQSYKKSIVG